MRKLPLSLGFLLVLICLLTKSLALYAQDWMSVGVQPPDREYIFSEDREQKKRLVSSNRKKTPKAKSGLQKLSNAEGLPFDISALALNFDSSGNIIDANGDVLITYSTLITEAQEARVDIPSNQADLKGDVRISDVDGNMTADSGTINLDTGAGSLKNAKLYFDEGGYRMAANSIDRESGETYKLNDALLTTCQCPEGEQCRPWSLKSSETKITREGYGQAWDTTLRVYDVPVFYFPYLLFPVKNKRQSGLLPASFGNSRDSGLRFETPLFLALDDSTDVTLTGRYENGVNYGVDSEFRKIFSRNNKMELGWIQYDESMREDGDLLGVHTDGIYHPYEDKPFYGDSRYAGYWKHNWRNDSQRLPMQLIVDANYVSDVLFLREYEKAKIGHYNDRFVTSQSVLRMPIGDYYSADLSSEYNQALVDNPDTVFQRLPEFNLTGMNSFRLFGENPLGLKLVTSSNLSAVNFYRKEGYDGSRSEIYERLKFPFHFRNYFDGEAEGNVRSSYYSVRQDSSDSIIDDSFSEDESEGDIKDSSSRVVPGFKAKLGTTFEKVMKVEQNDLIKSVVELGSLSRDESLARLKHTLEPSVKYNYVSNVDQSENPQFDSNDLLEQRSVVTYSLTQRLFGRFEPRNPYLYGIEETTPELEDLGSLQSSSALNDRLNFGVQDEVSSGEFKRLNRGTAAELVQFKLSQSYDFLKASQDYSSDEDPFSDVGSNLLVFPNEYVGVGLNSNYNLSDSVFHSYGFETQLYSKRGDVLRNQLSFVDPNVRQLESGIEFKLTDLTKLGYYTRYDDLSGKFIEQKGGIRFYSSCKCWTFDVQVCDKLNPNETQFSFNITLFGLGDIGNTFFKNIEKPTNQTSQ